MYLNEGIRYRNRTPKTVNRYFALAIPLRSEPTIRTHDHEHLPAISEKSEPPPSLLTTRRLLVISLRSEPTIHEHRLKLINRKPIEVEATIESPNLTIAILNHAIAAVLGSPYLVVVSPLISLHRRSTSMSTPFDFLSQLSELSQTITIEQSLELWSHESMILRFSDDEAEVKPLSADGYEPMKPIEVERR